MHNPKWCLFFDFHTMPTCPDVGAGFDADAFTDRVKACGVDFLVFPAKCNMGNAYYETKVGMRHPSLQYDLLGKMTDACQTKDIAFSAYINVGLSHEEALLHRDWTVLSPEGYTYKPDRLDHFFRQMCYNTAYGDHLIEMVKEVASGYPVSGLFLDCMLDAPCVGVECVREMKRRGIDWTDDQQCLAFGHESTLRMARRIADAATAIKPDLLLYFNGVAHEDQTDTGTYLELECLPTGGWGYEVLPLYCRYLRKLGKPLLNMTGRFHRSWGDFGGIRTEASLEYDCRYGLANGMRATIGDHLHPRGDLNHAVFDLIEPVYGRLQELEPWIDAATAVTEIAVVAPQETFADPHNHQDRNHDALKGAARMLCELKAQFDVLSYTMPWSGYRLLILPDYVTLDDVASEKIKAHLAEKGAILSTAWSGLDPNRRRFVSEDWGLTFVNNDPHDPAFYRVEAPLRRAIADMPHNFYAPGVAMEARNDTEVWARVVTPYYNRHWDGEHGYLYLPPDKLTEQPAVTRCQNVGHISHAIFSSYYNCAPVPLRHLVAALSRSLLPDPMVQADDLPSFARVTVMSQPRRRMVHLLSYVPERRGATTDMIEEPIELRDVALSLRTDDLPPQRVYVAPQGEALSFEVRDGYIHTTIPHVPGHAVIVFEQ